MKDTVAIAMIKQDIKDLKKMLKNVIKTGSPQFGLSASDIEFRIRETEMLIK